MAFVDRVVEYPNRYVFEDSGGAQTGPYTLIRDEGAVTEAGTLLNADNLNAGILDIIKSHVCAGQKSGSACAANSITDFDDIPFGQTFDSVPVVVASIVSTSTSPTLGSITVAVKSVTTSTFSLRVFNNTSAPRSPAISWVAVMV